MPSPANSRIVRCLARCIIGSCSAALATFLQAGTMSVSSSAPARNGFDISNFGARTGDDKFWAESGTVAGKAKGQTFRTPSEPTWLRSVTYKTTSGNTGQPTKTYTVRVGKVSGTTFTQTHTETFTQSIVWGGNQYMTWTFTNPVLLHGDTTYGVDVGMNSSTASWTTGIPYLVVTDDEYTGGQLYNSGGASPGAGNSTLEISTAQDRHFHLNIEAPSGTTLAFIAGNPPDSTSGNLVRPQLIAAFNQTLSAGTGNIVIRDITDTVNVITTTIPVSDPRITFSANTVRVATDGLIEYGRKYAVRINSGAILGTGGVAFAGWNDDATWNFNMAANDPLLAAITALKNHLLGTAVLTATQIATHSQTLNDNIARYSESAANISAVFSLITTYDAEVGPLWMVGGDLTRADEADDLPWTIYRTMQGIMDTVYKSSVLAQHEAVFTGYKFGSSARFPGNCATPPAGQTRTVAVNASFLDTFGRDTQGWGEPARRPTGSYLHPGGIATVTVPAALVGQGYQIRVGAHSWDHTNRPTIKRLDRTSLLYNINATTTKIASPVGGGIYIEVPKGKNAGVVNVTIVGAARSPLFQATSFKQTTLSEWQTSERTQPGPWADFQSDKFMFQVPRSWIYAYADPVTNMANWDKAMDAITDLMGFPNVRGKETMYDQVDIQLRSSVYAPGYPACNASYNPSTAYNGNNTHYLLTGPQNAPDYEFHEAGHGFFFPKFDGEQESTVNLLHVAVQTQKFGVFFDEAHRESNGYGRTFCTLPNTAVLWMTSFNFSPNEAPMGDWEKAYQPQGHAKFSDLARLFGWQGLNDFYYHYNNLDHLGQGYTEATDSLLLQLCKSYDKDVRPMMHFWGIHPTSPTTLGTSITALGLKKPVEIYDRIQQYKQLIPVDNAAYRTWCTNWWGFTPSINGFGVEREHARQWSTTLQNGTNAQVRFPTEIYDETAAAAVHARTQEILNLYYPTHGPSWDGSSSTSWVTTANWNSNAAPAAGRMVQFTAASTANLSTVLNADHDILGILVTAPTANVTIGGTNTLTLRAQGIDLSSATKNLTLTAPLVLGANQSWNVATGRTLAANGIISGIGTLTITGDGKVTLGGDATYAGTTTIDATGTLQTTAANVLPGGAGTGNLVLNGTLDLNGFAQSINGLSGTGIVDNTAAAATTLTLGGNDATMTFGGTFQDTGGALTLAKTGVGTLTLTAANTYAGATNVSAGTLAFSNIAPFANTSALSLAGGTLLRPTIGGAVIGTPITLGAAGTTAGISAPTNLPGAGIASTLTLGGVISGAGNVTFTSSANENALSTVQLTAPSTYTGSTLLDTAGTTNTQIVVRLGAHNALPTTTVVTIDGQVGAGSGRFADLNMNGFNQQIAGLTNVARSLRIQRIVNSDAAAAATLTIGGSGNYTFSGILGGTPAGSVAASAVPGSTNGNNFALVKSGTGTLTLSGANTYTGGTVINGGTLAQGASNSLPGNMIIGNGRLDMATFTETLSTLDVTGAATINFGTGGTLAFASSAAVDWTGGTLNVTGNFVSGASLRFGTNSSGLTATQLSKINVPGFTSVSLNSTGYLTASNSGATIYNDWAAGAAFNADANNDGIPNGIAWILGAANATAAAIAPTADITTDPAFLTFTFRRSDTANAANGVTIAAQYTATLGTWTTAVHDGTNIIITTTNDIAPGVDSVQVKIKRALAPAGRLFARLQVQLSP
jgi:autotransporter-associated beta strand protein